MARCCHHAPTLIPLLHSIEKFPGCVFCLYQTCIPQCLFRKKKLLPIRFSVAHGSFVGKRGPHGWWYHSTLQSKKTHHNYFGTILWNEFVICCKFIIVFYSSSAVPKTFSNVTYFAVGLKFLVSSTVPHHFHYELIFVNFFPSVDGPVACGCVSVCMHTVISLCVL